MAGRRGRTLVIATVVLLITAGVATGAYFLARSGGEDLDRARADGRAAGDRAGSARGAESGYRRGLREGRRAAYRSSYREVRRQTIAGGEDGIGAAATSRSCGDLVESGAGSYDVRSVDVICDIAVQVARQWETECASESSGSCTVSAGFACTYQQTGYELGSISCTEGARRVDFVTGA